MIREFITTRLTKGNRIFPSKIVIDDYGVTLLDPGLFSGGEKTIPFSKISSVKVICPFIGFSTILIDEVGSGSMSLHGFLREEVEEIKLIISKNV
jgi:hypothetical protein